MTTARITRHYAEWMEDAIAVEIPDGANVTDEDLTTNFETLYGAAFMSRDSGQPYEVEIDTEDGEAVTVQVTLEWEDEHRTSVESIDDDYEIERHPVTFGLSDA